MLSNPSIAQSDSVTLSLGTQQLPGQGSQYTAAGYRSDLAKHDVIPSMSRKGECHDNAVPESIFYDRRRRHSCIGYKAPLAYEMMNEA